MTTHTGAGPVVLCIATALMVLATGCSSAEDKPSLGGRGTSSATVGPAPAATRASPVTPKDQQPGSSRYEATIHTIGPELLTRMRYSHRRGCPVSSHDLRYLRLPYVGFDGQRHTGELVVHEDFARRVVGVFEELYDARWPIRQMQLVDAYRGDDDRSMAANNTSAYNCRRVDETNRWSAHAFGAAIDINPVQNPYVTGQSVAPPVGTRYAALDRSQQAAVPTGAIHADDVVVRAFDEIGWDWGGDWSGSKDYQHFSATAR